MNYSLYAENQAFTLPEIKHVTPTNAVLAIEKEDAVIVDIREEEELDVIRFDTTQVENLPISTIVDTYSKLPKDKPLIIACANGIRSVKIVNLFMVQGYTNAYNLDGGITQWYREGLPVLMQKHGSSGGCGCGCSCDSGSC